MKGDVVLQVILTELGKNLFTVFVNKMTIIVSRCSVHMVPVYGHNWTTRSCYPSLDLLLPNMETGLEDMLSGAHTLLASLITHAHTHYRENLNEIL